MVLAVVVLFIVYNKVTMTVFSIFDLYPYPIDGKYYLAGDLTVQVLQGLCLHQSMRCIGYNFMGSSLSLVQAYTPVHKTFIVFGVLIIALYVVAVPLFSVAYIIRHRSVLNTNHHLKRVFGFLYDGYKPEYCYW